MHNLEQIINDTYTEMILNDILDSQYGYNIKIKMDFDTAAWNFQPPHNIVIGNNITPQEPYYISSFLYHEVGHSHFTDKDLQEISNVCKENGVPFELFNLFEDARIEELIRVKITRKFLWTIYEKKNEAKDPVSLFFNYIQTEGLSNINDTIGVYNYYSQSLFKENSLDLIPLIKEFMNKYNLKYQETQKMCMACNGGKPGKGNDLSITLEFMTKPGKSEELMENCKNCEGICTKEENENIKERKPITFDDKLPDMIGSKISISANTNHNMINEMKHPSPWHYDKEAALVEKLKKIFISNNVRRINSSNASKKLNIKAFCNSSVKYYKRKTLPDIKKKKIVLMLDCSGSMYGTMKNMKTVVAIINRLAIMGIIEGHFIITGGADTTAYHQTFKFPVDSIIIESLNAIYGFEGIQDAMMNNIKYLRESDFNFFLTDGNITDKPVNKKFFHQMKIYTYAFYIGSAGRAKKLDNWFDKTIVKKDIENLIDAMVTMLKAKMHS